MAAPTRTSQFNKLHKILKKHYPVVAPAPDRTVFEHLVFAGCLEDAHYDPAEEAFASLVHNFFDWNEIRVSTVRELAEVMASLPQPPAAANRVKRTLQSVFESAYAFDLEELRKQNLGPAADRLRKLDGTTHFSVAYLVQVALGGHAIPVDAGALGALSVLGLVTEEDLEAGVVPGLERAIAKSKGLEFASQLHQLGADFIASPYAPALHEILLEVTPEARGRLPKRRARKRSGLPADPAPPDEAGKEAGKQTGKAGAAGSEPVAAPKKKRAGAKRKSAQDKAAEAKKKASNDPPPPAAKRKPPAAKKAPSAKKKADPGKARLEAGAEGKRSASAGLSRRKPR
jgi:endonuclease-3